MSKTYTKIVLTKGSEYTGVGAWKPKGDKAPTNLLASTMEFELNTTEMTPGKYRISFWKAKEKKTENSPDGSFIMERVEDDEASPAGTTTAGAGATPDFNF